MKKNALLLSLFTALTIVTMAQQDQMPKVNGNLSAYNASFLSEDNSFTKSPDDPITKDHNFYMHRSKNQRTIGWVTLGGGFLLSGIGILVANSQSNDFNSTGSDYAPGILLGLGALSGIVSIPFMIMAHSSKNKARLLIDNQKTGFGVPPNVSKDIVGVTVKITIGN